MNRYVAFLCGMNLGNRRLKNEEPQVALLRRKPSSAATRKKSFATASLRLMRIAWVGC